MWDGCVIIVLKDLRQKQVEIWLELQTDGGRMDWERLIRRGGNKRGIKRMQLVCGPTWGKTSSVTFMFLSGRGKDETLWCLLWGRKKMEEVMVWISWFRGLRNACTWKRVFVSEQTCSSHCVHRCVVSYQTHAGPFDGRNIKRLEVVVKWEEMVTFGGPKIRIKGKLF